MASILSSTSKTTLSSLGSSRCFLRSAVANDQTIKNQAEDLCGAQHLWNPHLWNLGEATPTPLEPLWELSGVQPFMWHPARFLGSGELPRTTPKLHWQDPKLFKLSGNANLRTNPRNLRNPSQNLYRNP